MLAGNKLWIIEAAGGRCEDAVPELHQTLGKWIGTGHHLTEEPRLKVLSTRISLIVVGVFVVLRQRIVLR